MSQRRTATREGAAALKNGVVAVGKGVDALRGGDVADDAAANFFFVQMGEVVPRRLWLWRSAWKRGAPGT